MAKCTKAMMRRKAASIRDRAKACGRTGVFEAFERMVRAWLEDPGRRDGRGVSMQATRYAHLGYERLGEVLTIAGDHEDHGIRRKARKALRAIERNHVAFEEAGGRLKEIRGMSREFGKRKQERWRIDMEKEERLNDRFFVKRIYSVRTLRTVGRTLENCCAWEDTARRYLCRWEMWVLLDREKPFWLLQIRVNGADRNIKQCLGYGNEEAKPGAVGRKVMRRLLETVDASADEFPTFASAGYHSALLNAEIDDSRPIEIDGLEFVTHRFEDGTLAGRRKRSPGPLGPTRRLKDGILVGRRKVGGKQWKWSPFCWKPNGSLESLMPWDRHIDEGKLLGLIVRCPELGARIHSGA